jgi:hypothetical protein
MKKPSSHVHLNIKITHKNFLLQHSSSLINRNREWLYHKNALEFFPIILIIAYSLYITCFHFYLPTTEILLNATFFLYLG